MESRALEPLRDTDPRMLGPYRLLNRIGEGGMGTIYLAEDPDGTRVAVKVIRREYAERPEFRRRFENEAAAASRVRAFCTARVLGACLTGPELYLATEYIVGHDLGRLVRARGPLTGSGLEQLAIGVATALAAIHDVGLVHRDLTPANVLSSETGLRVIDFGVARPLDVAGRLTAPGALVGTPPYMAPEVLGPEPVTTAYDIFAWGGVVVFAATGRPPFGAGGLKEVLHRIAHDPPRLAGLPPELKNVVEAALAKEPTHRPTAWELLRRLVGPGADDAERMARLVRPLPDPRGFVVVGGERGARYARRLVTHLRGLGLAVRSAYEEPDAVRRLDRAPALIVLVSPDEPDSVRHAVAEAGRLGLETFRILLDGAGTGGAGWYDARDGSMPGAAEIRWLQRMAAKDAPEPPAQADDRFAGLGRLLEEGRLVDADEETTALLLNAAGRAGEGWLRPGGLDLGFLRDLGTVWARGTDGKHGFGTQLRLHWGHRHPGSTADFRSLSAAFGWAEGLSGRPGSYREWVKRHTYPNGFFPTLRNPSDELHSGWYERWRITVMAVHTELRRGL